MVEKLIHIMFTVHCPHCRSETNVEGSGIFTCPECQQDFACEDDPSVTLPLAPPPITPVYVRRINGEEALFDELGVSVTRTRLIVGQQVYPIAGITSVRVGMTQHSVVGEVILLIIGSLLLISGAVNSAVVAVWGFLIIGGCILSLSFKKGLYCVFITTASGEMRCTGSKDKAFAGRVMNALNNAIAERG